MTSYLGGFAWATFWYGCALGAYGVFIILTIICCSSNANVEGELAESLLEKGRGSPATKQTRRPSGITPMLRSPLISTPGAMKKMREQQAIQEVEKAKNSANAKPTLDKRKMSL